MYKYIKTSFEEAYINVSKLANDFHEHKDTKYLKPEYQESEARDDFINKFFAALGWDVTHDVQKNPYRQEVKVEKNPDKGMTQRKADYAFYTYPNFNESAVCFFVEAKKPFVNIDKSKQSYFQLMSYGWVNGTSIGVLTDFEEFHVIDCRYRPNIDTVFDFCTDKYTYSDYLDKGKFAKIYYLLSREAVIDNSIEEYVRSLPKRSGKAIQKALYKGKYKDFDDTFLAELDDYREQLAKSIKSNNHDFDGASLTEITQRILDRLVFLRFLEDKGIETKDSINKIINSKKPWADFITSSRRLDGIYNGIVFKKHSIVDSDRIIMDEDIFISVCEGITDPIYNFNMIPIHVLGSIYEQFLGNVIYATAKQAKLIEKPEVKKAGGVYYTPEYIVNYIVENTVGRLIKDKAPTQIAKMRFADIACGSGSFLLGIYGYLLQYHQEWYNKNRSRIKKDDCIEHEDGTYHLSLSTKRRILLNNIYGVDIDPQAVEVAQLSLFLKLLEEETTESARNYQLEIHEAILPSLHDNIKRGNSLIGQDYFKGKNLSLIDKNEMSRINAFNWETQFKKVMDDGGFDAIIGNPPYVKEYTNRQIFHDLKETKLHKYYQGKMDIWYIFACLAIDILKDNGCHSFIAQNNWITSSGASKLREKLLDETQMIEFIDFGDYRVFKAAGIQTMIYLLKKSRKAFKKTKYRAVINKRISKSDVVSFLTGNNIDGFTSELITTVMPHSKENIITFVDGTHTAVLDKIQKNGKYRLSKNDVAQGIVSPQDIVIAKHLANLNDVSIDEGNGIFLLTEKELKRLKLTIKELEIIKPFYTTDELSEYGAMGENCRWVIYTTTETIKHIKDYPKIKAHLDRYKAVITSDNKPYGLHRARDERFFIGEKIISLRKTASPHFTFTDFPCYVSQTYNVIKPEDISLKYLTGLLNSKLVHYWLLNKGKKQGDLLQIDKAPILEIPIRLIDTSNKQELEAQDNIINAVGNIIYLKQSLEKLNTDTEKESVERQIQFNVAQIDTLVYELYGVKGERETIEQLIT